MTRPDAHVKYISEQLGHASVQITLDRYGHLFDQSYADESAKLEKALADALAPASGLQASAVQTDAAAFHTNGAQTQETPAKVADQRNAEERDDPFKHGC